MPFIPTPQGIEIVLKMTQNSVPVVNIFNFDAGHAVTLSDLNAAASAFNGWLTSDFAPLISSSVSFDLIQATDISVANGQQVQILPTTSNGGAAGTPAAANAALVVSLRTNFTGRSFRGRTYIGGLTQTVQTSAHFVTGTYTAAVISAWQNLISVMSTAGYILSVLSKYAGLVARVAGILTEVTAIIVNTTIDSQRRRNAN